MVDFTKKILNSDKFRKSALTYQSTGRYCAYPANTSEFMKFWDEEQRRCIKGYTAEDGDYITGYNYFYLNYCPIERIVYEEIEDRFGEVKKVRRRKVEFPDFYDYDYYFFHAIEEAEDGGKHMCVLKSRRKGYEQPYSELVATPDGFRRMGDLEVGDEVLTPFGTSTKVLEIIEQGYSDVYRLTLDDGRSVLCG